jgi:uncharacterized protein with PIN domain
MAHELAEQVIVLIGKVRRFQTRKGIHHAPRATRPPAVICDAGLGGLARWLRAAGCEAYWIKDIGDAQLVTEAERLRAVIITTDSLLLERRKIAHGEVRAIWVPPNLTRFEQLRIIRAELPLPEIASRCMACGGELLAVEKEAVKERIPPKTYKWLNEYFECGRCGHLFWEGTHWQRVKNRLDDSRGKTDAPPKVPEVPELPKRS